MPTADAPDALKLLIHPVLCPSAFSYQRSIVMCFGLTAMLTMFSMNLTFHIFEPEREKKERKKKQ